ncbi:LOW QUALITY PROTEIN: hypothetical protein KUTeg_010016 [Tegillarca granosa]|uniref:C2H2-type domain-containing protein n=1 Tax=Tegillarca granosa TaxID=220873 RepID=A0ABQ9FAI0_TEGGR|nr:LOW QUALITY PROTEIN: hypothetical protein KUTeg_010016 [Tegillarca granosa]
MFVHSNTKSFVLFLCKCGACKYGTNLINLFREHLTQTHPSEESYKCSSCNESFGGIEELVGHLQSNLLKFVQCPYCSVKDRNRRFILSHITQAHPGKVKQITVTSQLICHERENNAYIAPEPKPIEVLPGTLLNQSVNDKSSYQDNGVKQEPVEKLQETVGNSRDNVFQPDVPQKQARRTSEDSVKSDTRSGNNAMSLMKCPKCTYIASGKGFLKKHFKVHEKGLSKQRPFVCPYCPGESDIQSKFISHVGLHCGNQKPNGIFKIQVYFCSHCTFQSNLLGKIFAHGERAHANFRKETDYTTSTLKIKSRSFMCETCMFFTRSKDDFDRHLDMHKNGELSNSLNTSDTTLEAKPKEPGPVEPPSKFQNDIDTGNESRRFCCNECSKTFKRLPHLKQHLSLHIKNEAYQLTYFRCSYCGYSSTSKLCISRHSEEKHPGKKIRIKRRSVSSAKNENHADGSSDPPRVSIDTYHCDCCAFSCSDRDDLIRHTKLHFVTTSNENSAGTPKPDKPQKKPYVGPTEPFIIPAGNVYKMPVSCSKCNFNTKLRLELLRHVKMHPMLIPESEQSPRKEANPRDKATKLLVKTTFLKRRLSSSPEFKSGPRKKKKVGRLDSSSEEDDDYDDEMDFEDYDNNDEEKGQLQNPKKTLSQLSRKMEISKGSLYFLGGDLLHNKLKPCYSEEGGNGEYTCLYCGNELHEKYPLHKHLLQHMDVSFYKCAYCEFGSLEVTPIVIHIQRQHRKPIKHIQQPLNEVESKINKAIHDMKAQHYLGVPNKSPVNPILEDTLNIKMEMPDIEPAFGDADQFESEVNYDITSSFKQSPSKGLKSPERLSSKDSRDDSPSKLTKLAPNVKKSGLLFMCKICGYTSSNKATINRHSVVHTKFKQYGCPYCSYRSHWKQDVTKHTTNVHQGEKVHVVTYDDHDNLISDSPTKNVASEAENRESLDFKKESEIYRDDDLPDLSPATTEVVQKPILEFCSKFKCNICLKKFNSKWAIDKHFKSAECGKISMLGCSLCKFKNVKNENLLDHIKHKHPLSPSVRVITLGRSAKFRIHKIPVKVKKPKSGPPSVQSVVSDISLPKKSDGSVSKMKVERTRERNGLIKKVGNLYKCKVCSFRGQRSNVSRHLATHSQLIKHSCPYCEYKSNWNFNIKRHVLKYHPDEKFDIRTSEKQVSSTEIKSSLETKLLAEPTSMMDNSNQTVDKNIEIKQEPGVENEFKTKYKCLVCKQVKLSLSGMYRHLQADKCKKPMYGCPECRFKSLIKDQVKNHMETKHAGHPGSPHLLNINAKIKKMKYIVQTGSDGADNRSVDGSLKSSKKGNAVEVTCPSCLHVSPSRKLFQEHFDKSHKGMFLACTKCPYKTQLMAYLIKHLIMMHQSRDIQFEIHRKKMRNKDVRFQCPKCAHQAKKPNMRAHLYFHLDYRPINCGHCKYKTRKQMIAKKHILSNHPGLPLKIIVKQDKNVEAEIDQMLSSMKVAESDLQQHTVSDMEIKEKKQPMKCEFENCNFKCMKNKTMKMHMSIVHMSQDQHSETDFEISSMEPEKNLISNNTNEFPAATDDIFSPRKNYTTEYSAKLHKDVFKCIHCQYVATVKKSIVSHYYSHVPHIFKCPYCSYRNYPRSRIVHHITTNHGGKTIYVTDLRTNQTSVPNTSHTSSPSSSSTSSSPKKKTPTPPKKIKKEKKIISPGSYSDIFTSEGSSDDDQTSTPAKKEITYKETGKICYNCNFCSYTSSVFYHYRQHLATHGGFKWQSAGTIIESRLKCGMCAFLAINHEEFKNHMEEHLNTRPFVCPYCDFSVRVSVKKHVVNKHPNKPVEALKNDRSGDLVVSEGGPKKSIKLVEMDPKVKLYDIFSMESEDFEQLLTDADVSVIDLQYIPDEKFDIVSKTLGFSADDIQELEGSSFVNSSYEDRESKISDEEDQSLDTTLTEMGNMENEGGDSKLDDSINSTESMEYEVLDEVTDSVNEEHKTDTSPDNQDNGLEDISDAEDEMKDYTDIPDKEQIIEEKDAGKRTTNTQASDSGELDVQMKQDSNQTESIDCHQRTHNVEQALDRTHNVELPLGRTDKVEQALDRTDNVEQAVDKTHNIEQALDRTHNVEQALGRTHYIKQALDRTQNVEQALDRT